MIFQPDLIDLLLFIVLIIGVAIGYGSCKLAAFIEKQFEESRREKIINQKIQERQQQQQHEQIVETFLKALNETPIKGI